MLFQLSPEPVTKSLLFYRVPQGTELNADESVKGFKIIEGRREFPVIKKAVDFLVSRPSWGVSCQMGAAMLNFTPGDPVEIPDALKDAKIFSVEKVAETTA